MVSLQVKVSLKMKQKLTGPQIGQMAAQFRKNHPEIAKKTREALIPIVKSEQKKNSLKK